MFLLLFQQNLDAEQPQPPETIRHVAALTTSAAFKQSEAAEEESVDVRGFVVGNRSAETAAWKVLSSTNARNPIYMSAGERRCLQGPNTHVRTQENI